MERIYVDAAPVVYAVERRYPWCEAVDTRLSGPDRYIVSSPLTRLECLVVPLREGNGTLAAEFRRYFSVVVMLAVSLSDEVMDRAAEIRAEFGFRTPDAIHLAAA